MPAPLSGGQEAAYGVSAGLSVLSGVFGYLASEANASMARSRAALIMDEAQANAQRYREEADQQIAQTSVMYTASGVRLAGSPLDALATSARIANENVASILMAGETQAENEDISAVNSENQGRAQLVGAGAQSTQSGLNAYWASLAGGGGTSGPGGTGGANLGMDKGVGF